MQRSTRSLSTIVDFEVASSTERHSNDSFDSVKICSTGLEKPFGTAYTMYLQLSTNEQQKEFWAQFGATEESVKKDVQHLMEWLKKQPHLPDVEGTHHHRFVSNLPLNSSSKIF